MIRPACICLTSLAGRCRGRRRTPGGAEGAIRTDAAVSRAASIWVGCSGLALIATRSRLVSDGKRGEGCLSLAVAVPAQIAAIAINNAPTAPNAQNVPY